MHTVSSVNVNGVRAAAPKGFARWLARTTADVVCVQETRAELDEFPAGLLDGWVLSHVPGAQRGRCGVGVRPVLSQDVRVPYSAW